MPTKVTVDGVYKKTVSDHQFHKIPLDEDSEGKSPILLYLYSREGELEGHKAGVVQEGLAVGDLLLTGKYENNWVGPDSRNLTLSFTGAAKRTIDLEWVEGNGGATERKGK